MISVLMPVYKENSTYVKQAIESILMQSYSDIELIIVVDAPENLEIINVIKHFSKKDRRVRVLINKRNMGIVYSLNRALHESDGEYIARMDADDISNKERLKMEMSLLLNESLDLVATNIIDIDESGQQLKSRTYYPEKASEIRKYLKYRDCLPHPTWLGRRSMFKNLNGYRNIEFCEDYDFLIRGIMSGYKYGIVRKPLLYYRVNKKSISHTNQAAQMQTTIYLQSMYKKSCCYSKSDIEQFLSGNRGKNQKAQIDAFIKFISKRKQMNYFKQSMGLFKQIMFNNKIIFRMTCVRMLRYFFTLRYYLSYHR